eukprot:s1771_g13.t1
MLVNFAWAQRPFGGDPTDWVLDSSLQVIQLTGSTSRFPHIVLRRAIGQNWTLSIDLFATVFERKVNLTFGCLRSSGRQPAGPGFVVLRMSCDYLRRYYSNLVHDRSDVSTTTSPLSTWSCAQNIAAAFAGHGQLGKFQSEGRTKGSHISHANYQRH